MTSHLKSRDKICWQQVQRLVQDWTLETGAEAIVVYIPKSTTRHNVIINWAGSQNLRPILDLPDFKNLVTRMKEGKTPPPLTTKQKMEAVGEGPWTMAVKRALVSNLVRAYVNYEYNIQRSFWEHNCYIPEWWPTGVPFLSPNGRNANGENLTDENLNEVLNTYREWKDGGGGMTVKVIRNCIKLAVEADQISSDDYISSKYVLDCVAKNKLLPTDKYRLETKKRSDDTCDNIQMSDEDDLCPAAKIQRTEALTAGRSKYSVQDDKAILDYFVKNRNIIPKLGGVKVWRDMELLKVTDHSSESMKDRYRKRILPNLDSYDVPDNIKFLLTPDTKYLEDNESSSKQKADTRKQGLEFVTRRKRVHVSDHESNDSFDQNLLENADKHKSPRKGTNSVRSPERKVEACSPHRKVQIVLEDVIHSVKSPSPKKPVSPSKQKLSESNQKHKDSVPKKLFPSNEKQIKDKVKDTGNPRGYALRSVGGKQGQSEEISKPSIPATETSKNPTRRFRRKPKANTDQPSMDSVESQENHQKSPVGIGEAVTQSDRGERLNYVMANFFESHDDEATQPPEESDSDLNSDEEKEIQDTTNLVRDMCKQYGLRPEEVIHAFYINNGSCEDTVNWIETGLNVLGLTPWDHRDDVLLKSSAQKDLECLKVKYGAQRVNKRLLFLEGL